MATGDKWVSVGFLCGAHFISAGSVIEQVDHEPPRYRIVVARDSAPPGLVMPENWWPNVNPNRALTQVVPYEGA
jgi:hypothetical protein